jgi:uncharacterized lipoprotein YajG
MVPNFTQENCMKRLALVTAIFAVAACSKADNTPAADTTTPAMAPAPAPTAMDTSMKMDTAHKTAMDTSKTKGSKTKGTKTKGTKTKTKTKG